ncbi:MAG: SAM-dependent methyltransferase, partial [Hyphomicrobiales bacterium]|nr:SAM-dependent methyltransferase [Hyphomicrobiales bacterium]
TGHGSDGGVPSGVNWEHVAIASPVIVMYMATRNLPTIAQKLISFGRSGDEPVAVVSNASLPEQSTHVTTLAEVCDSDAIKGVPTPALVVLGDVVNFHETLDWYAEPLRENSVG